MTWTSFHRREDVLRDVVAAADARRDGILPVDVAGVREAFGDELGLLGALTLRWHTRLAGRIERELDQRPAEPEEAVVAAWRATAEEQPGVRAVLDHQCSVPPDPATAAAMSAATAKEHTLLAVMAGRANAGDAAAGRVGALLERRARARLRTAGEERAEGGPTPQQRPSSAPSLLARLKAALAA